MPTSLSLAELRLNYTKGRLRRSDLAPEPVAQFQAWFQTAQQAGILEPNAMTFATAGLDGIPSVRTLLLKGVDARGFIFFTNYESRKGRELAANPAAAINIFWRELERQVCVKGAVAKASPEEADVYFASRPLGSRLAAWVSQQSSVIPGRAALEERLGEVRQRFPGETVPRPPHWGGYVLEPSAVEFWQGGADRLHDRFLYTKRGDGTWQLDRLSP